MEKRPTTKEVSQCLKEYRDAIIAKDMPISVFERIMSVNLDKIESLPAKGEEFNPKTLEGDYNASLGWVVSYEGDIKKPGIYIFKGDTQLGVVYKHRVNDDEVGKAVYAHIHTGTSLLMGAIDFIKEKMNELNTFHDTICEAMDRAQVRATEVIKDEEDANIFSNPNIQDEDNE